MAVEGAAATGSVNLAPTNEMIIQGESPSTQISTVILVMKSPELPITIQNKTLPSFFDFSAR